MPLDPQAQKVVEMVAALNLKPIPQSTPDEARESMRTRTAGLGPVEDVPAVADHHVPVTGGEIPVRVYSPAGNGPHPVLVFFHGGGWVIGDLDTHDGTCRALANAAGCAVVSVDYRLAPEIKYPRRPRTATPAAVGGGQRREPRARPRADRGGRRQRGRQPRRGRRAHGARPARPAARAPAPDLPGDRLRVRHAVLPRERRGLLPDHRGHALVLRAVPSREEHGREPYASPLLAKTSPTCRPRS